MSFTFEDALRGIRNGWPCSLHGLTLTVNDVSMAITDDQFDQAWDAMDEAHGGLENSTISLNASEDS